MRKIIPFLLLLCLTTSVFAKDIQLPPGVVHLHHTALLVSVLERCNNDVQVKKSKPLWEEFSVDYGIEIIQENEFDNETVVAITTAAEIIVDKKYGNKVPKAMCSEALNIMMKMKKLWQKKSQTENPGYYMKNV